MKESLRNWDEGWPGTTKRGLLMVGAFPPPVRGMPVVNASVRAQLRRMGVCPLVVNLSARGLERSMSARLARLPAVLSGLWRVASVHGRRVGMVYMSVSGGVGQVYEILFLLLARLYGMRPFLHHHSFAYLNERSWLTGWLVRVAGQKAVHITQSQGMAERLRNRYGAQVVVAISNAVFLVEEEGTVTVRSKLRTAGFFSNISSEKGVFEFLDLFAAARDKGLGIQGRLAGPFQDIGTERRVMERLAMLPNVEYVGPKSGADKDEFFAGIDVLIFPSRYENETEGIVNHEAMSRGIPVIAYGRGCIPEILGSDCGKVIAPESAFVGEAIMQLETWLRDPNAFHAASQAAVQRFSQTYAQNEGRWKELLNELTKCACLSRAGPEKEGSR